MTVEPYSRRERPGATSPRATARCGPLSLALAALLLLPAAVSSQSIRGQVLDAERGVAIASVEVTATGDDGGVTRSLTDAQGRFLLELPAAGRYRVQASSLGYVDSDSATVEVQTWVEVQITVRLSTRAIEIEGVTVETRGFALRHRATLPGFLERRKSAHSVGTARLVTKDDGQMRASTSVGDVMRWFLDPNGCMDVYVDGRYQYGSREPWELLSTHGLAGIEFYRDHRDAPLELRNGGECTRSPYSVLAIWREPLGGGG